MPTDTGDEVEAEAVDDEPEDLDEAVLDDEPDELDDDDVDVDDALDDDDDDAVIDTDVAIDVVDPDAPIIVPLTGDPEDTSSDDDDDEEDDDDVEASLDVILKERLVVEDEDEDEDEEVPDAEDRADGTQRVLPKQPGEFVCQSCFLVKSETQLADSKRMLCRDCV